MRRNGLLVATLFLALVGYRLVVPEVWSHRQEVRAEIPAGYIIPSRFSRVLALGHQGVLSDFLFLKTATFIGGRSAAGQAMSEEDWDFVVASLDVITDLDPYFSDPYWLGTGLLTWDAQRFDEANRLLKKGMQYRDWDWQLPFYVGFNYFYFLNDYANGSKYLMQAAELPGSPGLLKTLAARISYYAGQSRTALAFLHQMLSETRSEALRQRLSLRLQALQSAVAIEEALALFKEQEGRVPEDLTDLVRSGYLDELPQDPYGGDWIILPNGRVYSTSRFAEKRAR